MNIAVVGVTGLVGSVILEVLKEMNLPVTRLIPVASPRSVGRTIEFDSRTWTILGMEEAISLAPDIAIFSAGAQTSLTYAPRFAGKGAFVIDNSSAWRMHEDVKLVVPEINAHLINTDDRIIANPNCSTIQMVVALAPLHKKYGIKRLVISTYQSFTGTGVKAVQQYESEKMGLEASEKAYLHPIFENCIPHCDVFFENGYTKEEMKLVHETRKILQAPGIQITATAVRVPVYGGHSESVNVELASAFEMKDVKYILERAEGLKLLDRPGDAVYPMPLMAKNKNDVFVGRLRRDESLENGLNMWSVAYNLRKGAATNAVQIAEYLYKNGLVKAAMPA